MSLERITEQTEKYSLEWFKERAINSLKRIDDSTWDFSDSLIVYVPQGVDAYKTLQEDSTSYHDLVTVPETNYIKKIAPELIKELPDQFNYIDLGPGTEHKEQYFFEAVKSQNKTFNYFPVDVSQKVLSNAMQSATSQNIQGNIINAPFEECAQLLPLNHPRFVSLGLTFPNFEINHGLTMMNKIMGEKGYGFINAHIRERVNIKAVQDAYSTDAWYAMMTPKLTLVDIDVNKDVSTKETTDEIKVWYTISNPSEILIHKGVKAGDKLLVFQSLRYFLPTLLDAVKEKFPNSKILDTGDPFVGILLKN